MEDLHLIREIERLFPVTIQESWDNSGWQIKLNNSFKKIIIALSISQEVVNEAIEKEADLIITHHPLFFKAQKSIVSGRGSSDTIIKLIQKNISLYSTHTPADAAPNGIADTWADKLNLTKKTLVEPIDNIMKLVIFVPKSHSDKVRDSICTASNGTYESYKDVSFETEGTGRFTPLSESNPYIGEHNKPEAVTEKRIETVFRKEFLPSILNAIKTSHPYEKPAYEIFPITYSGNDKTVGIGRKGVLPEPVTLPSFLKKLEESGLEIRSVSGKIFDTYKKVAIVPGSGKSLLHFAEKESIFITGDTGYHDAEFAQTKGFTLIDVSHYSFEKIFIDIIKNIIKKESYEGEVIASSKDRDYFTYEWRHLC